MKELYFRILCLLSIKAVVTLAITRSESTQVQVHFVPHSHMDAGWLKTYDGYYDFKVKRIFNSVFKKLQSNPIYTYTLGDLAFFRRYYYELQSDKERDAIKQLYKNGQLEFVQGGFVSPDEATTNYADIMRNFEAGHDFLRNEFGVTPRIGWQLDPFGHSAMTASMLAQMGMEAVFFARINRDKHLELRESSDLEFIWEPNFANNTVDGNEREFKAQIFAHKLYEHYCPPQFVSHFGFERLSSYGDAYIRRDVSKWMNYFDEYLKGYKTTNILVLWGDDFAHVDANRTYRILDTTIKEIQNHLQKSGNNSKFNLKYSTIDEYLSGVYQDAEAHNVTFKKEHGDFWEYNHDPYKEYAYWTGYFTTNSDFKANATDFGDFTHSAQQLTSLSSIFTKTDLAQQASRLETVSIMQHHDAMTGTHPHLTGVDYLKMMDSVYD